MFFFHRNYPRIVNSRHHLHTVRVSIASEALRKADLMQIIYKYITDIYVYIYITDTYIYVYLIKI